ncbi:unnamed protein product [Musa acuminata subsp. burmannicoides]|uniref:Uncharacterized protein n=1 Tax=Musa acuminata subsp. malaccensis TaxID=214687 RepID=A0A804KE88_MUSAM|nr:PREDICTED: uncharacterized protein LOC103996544 [Musa acuminata subsp. malaccensis]
MLKSRRGKSAARKPLGDISNGRNPLRSHKKGNPKDGNEGAFDRLLLVRSDLSDLIGQIDELVAQAIKKRTISKKVNQDLDSFMKFLSEMHLSLKPWFSRLQQSLDTASTTPEKQLSESSAINFVSGAIGDRDAVASNRNEPELELMVSPSPLVSWRAGTCTVDCGRQLFLLTPLPKNKAILSEHPGASKSVIGLFTDKEQSICHQLPPSSRSPNTASGDLVGKAEEKQASTNVSTTFSFEKISGTLESGYLSPLSFSNRKNKKNNMHLLTPCLPKNSGLLDPIFEPCQQDGGEISEIAEDNNDAKVCILPTDEVSDCLSTKYQELFGLQPASRFVSRRKEVDETLSWFLSPPKTCILLEPSDEKPLPTPANNRLSFATPIWKDLESIQKVKPAGEATLKRELWTRFEAVSSSQLHFDVSVFRRTVRKGFLDMLEEVSGKTTDSNSIAR